MGDIARHVLYLKSWSLHSRCIRIIPGCVRRYRKANEGMERLMSDSHVKQDVGSDLGASQTATRACGKGVKLRPHSRS